MNKTLSNGPELAWGLDTGTKPSKYTLATKETLIKMLEEKEEELKISNEGLTVAYMHGFEKGKNENQKLRNALEDITTLRQSTIGDYPVMLSDGEMFKIAKEALK